MPIIDKAWVGQRVTLQATAHTYTGRLDGTTPERTFLTTATGEVIVTTQNVVKAWLDPLVCHGCGAKVNRLFEAHCAECVRDQAAIDRAARVQVTWCQDCGAAAFFSPRTQTYRCADCHLATGGLSARLVVAEARCKGRDIHDAEHDWKQMRSSWVCRDCKHRTYDQP